MNIHRLFEVPVLSLLAFVAGCGCSDSVKRVNNSSPPSRQEHTVAKIELPVTSFVSRYPAYLTAYDVMTPEDEMYYRYLGPMCEGSTIADWKIVKDILELGQGLLNANLIASLSNTTVPLDDQPRAKPCVDAVKQCAVILGIDAPRVYIGNPYGLAGPRVYVTGLKKPHVLVLTPEFLELFGESPEERMFMFGHALGLIKTGHVRTHFLGEQFLFAIAADSGRSASFAQDLYVTGTVGSLLHWFRESEYSADRAGLLCVGGNLRVAQQALLRLDHMTKPSNQSFDSNEPDFDFRPVLEKRTELRSEPFVKFVSYIQGLGKKQPFVIDRCAALENWTMSADYNGLLNRQSKSDAKRFVVIKTAEVSDVPAVDYYVPFVDSGAADPFVRVAYAEQSTATQHRQDVGAARWEFQALSFPVIEGADLIVEVLDYNSALAETFIGSCVIPIDKLEVGATSKASTEVRLDVLSASTVVDRPTLTLEYEIVEKKPTGL